MPTVSSIDVCICTHNPGRENIARAVNSIVSQTDLGAIEILLTVIDNGSVPEIEPQHIKELTRDKIPWRIVREPRLGVARARLRAILAADSPWILFVDDDNELDRDYIQSGLEFILENSDVGCFGGKLVFPNDFEVPDWAVPFLPYLAIKDVGSEILAQLSPTWGPWEPPTAGAWVRQDVAQVYADRMMSDPILFDLGRTGAMGLGSCEDSLMMRGAFQLGLKNAYVPQLKLTHHISPKRINYPYLLSLLAGYGKSQVLLEHALGEKHPLADDFEDDIKFQKILNYLVGKVGDNPRYRAARLAWYIGARRQFQFLSRRSIG